MRSTVPSTRTSPPRRSLQQGQAIVLVALLILVLFGMLGLAIDSGRSYVDRRDQQTAVDAAALAAGDWYLNYFDISTYAVPKSVKVYETNVHIYTSVTPTHTFATVGAGGSLPQDTYTYNYPSGYTLTVVATNTQFNGYQFVFTSSHTLPLAFLQIFGGPATVGIGATATGIVGNQRQQPAILTLSTGACSLSLIGGATLTVLGDTYSNGTACVGAGLRQAGNCYGATGSTCSSATYYCYNSSPGFVPYPPPCNVGDTQGSPVVPAATLPDPGYQATSVPYYNLVQSYNRYNRGTYTEMLPGQYGNFHLVGGSASCAFLAAGVYNWTAGYQSDASGSLLSNELKPPDEMNYAAPGQPMNPGPGAFTPQFWNQNGVTCSGEFNLAQATAAGYGLKHQGGLGNWGIELTSVRYDRFIDPTVVPNSCYNSPGCRRESAPSACQQISTDDTTNPGIVVNITRNAPGAQYYNVYINPNGCDGIQNNFSFLARYLAPGFVDAGGPPATAAGPYPSGPNTALVNGVLGWACPVLTITICNIAYNNLSPTVRCNAQVRSTSCRPPDPSTAPQCFQNCTPPPTGIAMQNAPFGLQYPPYSGGDMANENYCMDSPNPGAPSAPCQGTQVTPGAVQFYFPNGSCMTQNASGATYVFGGRQYNWIVIYMVPANTCANTLNGGSSTQYIGTLYSPAASWTINGGNIAPLAGQVIVYTAKVAGGATVGIDFNPNYSPAPPAARLIN